jgi:SnoaL-like polyketide cyclase
MSSEANKAVFRAVVDALAQGRDEVRDAHPGLARMTPGPADSFGISHASSFELCEVIADGDWVAARLVQRGRSAGGWCDHPPQGLEPRREAIITCRFSGGVIVELHGQSRVDGPWMHQQPGEATDEKATGDSDRRIAITEGDDR